ncbi:MAG: DUF4302 domain-containing protein [Bacteroidota bacterium]
MKKFLLFFISITILFSACKKEDDFIFDKSPDERINESIAKYQALLTGAENGWKAYITVNNGEGPSYAFYFKFDNANRVKMVSDFDTAASVTLTESSYRIRHQQQPTLIFDTYSYVHILADPNESNAGVVADINGGPVGQGLLSDFEFIIDEEGITNDQIEMVGKVNGAVLTLVRATKAESDIFANGQWNLVSKYFDYILTYYRRVSLDGKLYDVKFDSRNHEMTFSWLDGTGDLQTHTSTYFNTISGLTLSDPLQNDGQTITSISVDSYNSATNTITIKSGTLTGTVAETILPLKIDEEAPANWLEYPNQFGGYWASWDGFHVNGVDDAYQIKTLDAFYQLAFFPKDYFGTTTELLIPLILVDNALDFEYYFRMQFTHAEGIGKFRLRNTSSDPATPTTGPARLTRNLFTQTEGFYFVQTSETTYDMVSAKDGKAWMTWFF